ncbi:MAG: hypothetical protein KDJ90_12595 [Nitratireductor sp.]|nr:hypothetical protein [Nitratireductor sp.]
MRDDPFNPHGSGPVPIEPRKSVALIDIPRLTVLVDLIDTRLAAIGKEVGPRPAFSSETMSESWDWMQRKESLVEAFRQELAAEQGARFSSTGSDHRMRLAGVSSSCTMGWEALLGNWQNAARRRIAEGRELAGEPAR